MSKFLRLVTVLGWVLLSLFPGAMSAGAQDKTTGAFSATRQESPEAQAAAQPRAPGAPGVNSVANSPTQELIAGGTADSRVIIWDSTNGQVRFDLPAHAGAPVSEVAFSPDGKTVASAGRDSLIRLWDVAAGSQVHELAGQEQPARSVAFSPDGALLATSGEDSRVLLWDAATGKLRSAITGNADFFDALVFSPDGQLLAGAGHDGRITLWDVASEQVRTILRGHEAEVTGVAFSPDGATLASVSTDATLRLWDVATGTQRALVRGPAQRMTRVAYSPDGQVLATAGDDKMVTLRDPATGRVQRTLNGHTAGVTGLAFTSDSRRLDSSGADNQVIQWDLATGQPIRTFVPPAGAGIGPAATSANDAIEAATAAVVPEAAPATAAAAAGPIGDGPGGPILVIVPSGTSFGRFYAEILRNEGLNEFAVADISTVSATTLAGYDLVILAQTSLSAGQASMFSTWVNGGGKLIAMRPDKQLAGLLGLTDTGATLAEAYLRVDTSRIPGNGIVADTIQFHGTADRYTLNGAAALATLYSDATTATTNPAVTLINVGGSGGQAAAFTFDLASSVVYSRQGNPSWNGQERDSFTPIRSDDLYFGAKTGDIQRDWVDLNKALIPQADEQQRLLANLILNMNLNKKPLPRFWYFPRGVKAVVVMTGDDHGNGGTSGRFDQFISLSPAGCNVDNWECIRGTSYIVVPSSSLTNAQAASYTSQGFEVALHVTTNCLDWTASSLDSTFTSQLSSWSSQFSSLPAPQTNRTHCIVWSDWGSQPKVELSHNIRLDTNYYYWPSSWITNRPGFFTGSGMPMRFVDLDGTLIDVYQATSQMTDESGQAYPYTVDTLLDAATGPSGFYGAFTINAHTDTATETESTTTVASAQAHGVPVVSARQMLTWLDGRNNSAFANLAWNGTTLSFTVSPAAGANGLQVMVPVRSQSGVLTGITLNGSAATYTIKAIKGVEYAFTAAPAVGATGSYVATYAADTTAPTVIATVPAGAASGVDATASVSVTFSEAMDPASINGASFQLRDAANNLVAAAVTYDAATRSGILKPNAALAGGATYTAKVFGGTATARAGDLAGNALAADTTWTFTTASGPACPCSIWDASATPAILTDNDPNAVQLGVKFRSDVAGKISGIRFYKGPSNTGTHTGSLWTSTGQLLASATFGSETASGWQQVNFATPVAIAANTVYVAAYHTTSGYYSADVSYFANSGVDKPPLHALRNGDSGGNGVYAYGPASGFPSNTYNSSNYWVDVVFTLDVADTTPPTVVSTSPAAGAGNVAVGSTVRATFSEAMSAATISTATFELRDPSNTVVPAAVSYDGGTNSAVLTPNASLAPNTAYTARVVGGASGVKDLAGNALASDFTWSFTTGSDPCAGAANPIVAENCLAGNPASEWDITGAGDSSIQGFATDISVNRGSAISFKVNTAASAYRIDIYRFGYYGGMGARKVATVQPSAALPQTQPNCLTNSTTGLIDCGNWAISASWTVPGNATSGVYLARLVRTDTGGASHILFVVRDDSSTSDLLFQTSDTTWQAYNQYGGNSLYAGGPGTNPARAYKVSYNRPITTRATSPEDYFFNAEYPMIRWLEANGYNVSYFTGVDSDRLGNLIPNHKTFLSVGHDEYWSGGQRTNVEAARNAGVSLAFFSANEIFWKTRWENSIDGSGTAYRTLVCYKETHANAVIDPADPPTWTGTWRDPRFSPPADGGRPENALSGASFLVNGPQSDTITVPAADGKMRFWRNTSIATLAAGTTATLVSGSLGAEWDTDPDNGFRPAGLIRLSTTTLGNKPVLQDYGSTYAAGTATHYLTLYRHSSGALVFGAGTYQWPWGLDGNHDRGTTTPDVRMQQATVNLLADMRAQPVTLQAGLAAATASTDTAPPSSTITSPAANSSVTLGTAVTISGTATDTGGGVVGGVEVSVDGGTTWHPAAGRGSWTYSWTPTTSGSVTIKSRAADDSGNLETAGAGITVTVGDTTPPAAPKGLTATGSTSGVALVWIANTETDLAGYNVYRSASSSGPFTKLNAALLTVTSYNDTAAPAGVYSYYRVTAVDIAGNESSPATATALRPDTVAPAAPAGLTATATATGISLAWSTNTEPDIAGYDVYRSSSSGGPFSKLNLALLTTPGYDDTLAPNGTSYYQVTAVDLSNNASVPSTANAAMALANRVQNAGFELDANADGRPDSWTSDGRFTRSNAAARSGTYSGRHFANNNAGYTVSQAITGLAAGTTYTFAGWVSIPATTDAFTFRIQIRWLNASNGTIRTDTVKTYTASTSSWNKATASLVAPANTASAQILMVVSSLKATIYVDDFAYR